MTKNTFMAATGMLALFAAAPALAQTTTNVPVGVSLVIGPGPSCTVTGATVVDFPLVGNPITFLGRVFGSDVAGLGGANGQGATIVCTSAPPLGITVQVNAGLSDSGGVHRLASGSNRIIYRLYGSVDGLSREYLIGVPQTVLFPGVGVPFGIFFSGYIDQADINAAPPGTYSDTLASTVTF